MKGQGTPKDQGIKDIKKECAIQGSLSILVHISDSREIYEFYGVIGLIIKHHPLNMLDSILFLQNFREREL